MRRSIAAVVLVVCACSPVKPPERDPYARTLAGAVKTAYDAHTAVSVRTTTSFTWDRLFVFRPKLSPDEVNRALGISWTRAYTDETNEYCLLVFMSGSTVTHSLNFARYQGDCTTLPSQGPYSPASARFTVTSNGKTIGGDLFLQLHPAA